MDIGAGLLPRAFLHNGVQYVEAVEEKVRVHLVLEVHVAELGLMPPGTLGRCLPLHLQCEVHHEHQRDQRGEDQENHHAGILQNEVAAVVEVRVDADGEDERHGHHQDQDAQDPSEDFQDCFQDLHTHTSGFLRSHFLNMVHIIQ